MVNIGDVYETTDRPELRGVRRLRVYGLSEGRYLRQDAYCEVSRKTDRGWTGYTTKTVVFADRLNRKNHFRLLPRGK